MKRTPPILPGRCLRGAQAAALAAAILTCAPSGAQVQPYQSRFQFQQPDGRLFDANPQIGAGRQNTMLRPVTPMLTGNLIASGNVRGGLALRTFDPIGDPLAFRAGLPSAGLSSFVRDSISVADSRAPLGGLVPRPFFDPARTAPTGAFLAGQYGGVLGTRVASAPRGDGAPRIEALPGLLNYAEPIDARIDLSVNRALPGYTLDRTPKAALTASIFGIRSLDPDSQAARDLGPVLPRDASKVTLDDLRELTAADDRRVAERLDLRLPIGPTDEPPIRPTVEPLNFSLDAAGRRSAARRPDEGPGPAAPFGRGGAFDAYALSRITGSVEDRPEGASSMSPTARATPPGGPFAPPEAAAPRPGRDLFTDMQLAVALQRDPSAAWFKDMQRAMQQGASQTGEVQEFAALQSQEFIERMMGTPLKSFAGLGDDAVNSELRGAEALLRGGRYLDAAGGFQRAALLDPHNPLPQIGRGHALLAGGDYLSASVALVHGLERFPELSRFSVDLTALLGSGEVIDIRRADLMRRLEVREDPRLRFLLGYLEYHSGDRVRGLENLDRAAESPDADAVIRRYPDMLRGKGVLPPPKLTPSAPRERSLDAPVEPTQSTPPAPGGDAP